MRLPGAGAARSDGIARAAGGHHAVPAPAPSGGRGATADPRGTLTRRRRVERGPQACPVLLPAFGARLAEGAPDRHAEVVYGRRRPIVARAVAGVAGRSRDQHPDRGRRPIVARAIAGVARVVVVTCRTLCFGKVARGTPSSQMQRRSSVVEISVPCTVAVATLPLRSYVTVNILMRRIPPAAGHRPGEQPPRDRMQFYTTCMEYRPFAPFARVMTGVRRGNRQVPPTECREGVGDAGRRRREAVSTTVAVRAGDAAAGSRVTASRPLGRIERSSCRGRSLYPAWCECRWCRPPALHDSDHSRVGLIQYRVSPADATARMSRPTAVALPIHAPFLRFPAAASLYAAA